MSTISASTTSTTAFKITTDTTGALVFQTGASPTTAATLDASGNLLLNTTSLSTYKANLNGTVGIYGGNGLFLQNSLNDAAAAIYNGGSTGVSQIQFNTSSTERMRLDASGNLGLGVTPSASTSNYKTLQIGSGSNSYSIFGQRVAGSSETFIGWNAYGGSNTSSLGSGFYYRITGDAATLYTQNAQHNWWIAPTGTAGNAITFTQAMTLDSSGNLGLGVTPSAWGSGFKALEIISAGSALWSSGVTDLRMSANMYYNGGYKYAGTGAATRFEQSSGTFAWLNAPSGTAGNAISFTQAMTLNASGRLLVGTTSDVNSWNNSLIKMRVENGIQFGAYSCIAEDLFDADSLGICVDSTENLCFGQYTIAGGSYTERARIDASGNLLVGASSFTSGGIVKTVVVDNASSAGFQIARNQNVASYIYSYSAVGFRVETTSSYARVEFSPGGTGGVQLTSGATSWTSLSDENTKTDLVAITNAAEKVATLRAVTGRFKTDEVGKSRAFLIAQDVLSVLPEAVSPYTEKDGTEHLGLSYTEVIPLLVASIKELKARIETLEAA